MEAIMRVTEVSSRKKGYDSIKILYHEAFPRREQIPFSVLRLMAHRKGINFLAFYEEDELCGMTYLVRDQWTVFVLFLAIDGRKRDRGYGTRILRWLKSRFPDCEIVLEIEPLDEEQAPNHMQRKKRMEFYERSGIRDTGWEVYEGDVRYWLLSSEGRDFDPYEFRKLNRWFSLGYFSEMPRRRKQNP
jgi:hypothetical protein